MTARPLLGAALALILAAGCATTGAPSARPMTATRLYLGTKIGRDREVQRQDWEAFLSSAIVARFPDGLSVEEATGFWRDQGGATVRERSYVIVLVHDDASAEVEARIRAIEAEWKTRFQQEAVLRVDEPVRASFD